MYSLMVLDQSCSSSFNMSRGIKYAFQHCLSTSCFSLPSTHHAKHCVVFRSPCYFKLIKYEWSSLLLWDQMVCSSTADCQATSCKDGFQAQTNYLLPSCATLSDELRYSNHSQNREDGISESMRCNTSYIFKRPYLIWLRHRDVPFTFTICSSS